MSGKRSAHTYGRNEKCITNFSRNTWRERRHVTGQGAVDRSAGGLWTRVPQLAGITVNSWASISFLGNTALCFSDWLLLFVCVNRRRSAPRLSVSAVSAISTPCVNSELNIQAGRWTRFTFTANYYESDVILYYVRPHFQFSRLLKGFRLNLVHCWSTLNINLR
jgi:hypothetical protein